MLPDYLLDYDPATPEYVLGVLREWHRIAAAANEADPSVVLTSETPLWEWEDALLIESWERGGLQRAMNKMWEVKITLKEWQQLDADSTLGDLCRLIATQARRPILRAWRRPVGECRAAGAFLTIRSILLSRGVRPHEVTPSSPILTVPTRHLNALFRKELIRLAPGRLPPSDRRSILQSLAACWLLLGATLGLVVVQCAATTSDTAFMFGIGILVSAAGCGWYLSCTHRRFAWSDWAESRTFRDLAYAVAGQEPRRRIKPTP